jgi:heat shock protein HslJ
MRSITYLPQLLTVFVVSAAAAAQSPWGFPVGQRFTAVSLNGQSYGAKAPTITVNRDVDRDVLRGDGFAGCNRWFARVTLGQHQFGVGELGTTKMFCADRMAAESHFLNALKTVKRWRMDGPRLVLEGERTTLLLSPAASNKP